MKVHNDNGNSGNNGRETKPSVTGSNGTQSAAPENTSGSGDSRQGNCRRNYLESERSRNDHLPIPKGLNQGFAGWKNRSVGRTGDFPVDYTHQRSGHRSGVRNERGILIPKSPCFDLTSGGNAVERRSLSCSTVRVLCTQPFGLH